MPKKLFKSDELRKSGILLILFIHLLFLNLSAQLKNPHGNIQFQCNLCHSENAWTYSQQSTFDHSKTGYNLLGQHAEVKCLACHRELIFGNIGVSCEDCHNDVHNGEQGPDCTTCHNPQSWENRMKIFKQHEETRFSLTGAHFGLDCEACHRLGPKREYKNTPVECQGCHIQNYYNTKNPNHVASGFPIDCANCHSISSMQWGSSSFDHSLTAFPLSGVHSAISCEDCHNGNYSKISGDCFDCHQSAYDNTTNPDHAGFQFEKDCETCHDANSWDRAVHFDHFAQSDFQLEGAHQTVDCIECHINFQLTGLQKDCYGCHQKDYEATTNPDHNASGIPKTCETCHSLISWSPADFDHNNTNFPLTGAHISLDCIACHEGGYVGISVECVSCHQNDYDVTTDPNHNAANFPTDCLSCHNTSFWKPANWDHDGQYFPIYSGKHRGEWSNCIDCHTNPDNYSLFECIYCHEHSRSKTDSKHREVSNYVYSSAACYDCHPRGESEEDKTGFPLNMDRIR